MSIRYTPFEIFSGFRGKFMVVRPNAVKLGFVQFFEIEQGIVRAFQYPDDFVELDLHGLGVAVLGILDEKDHEKRDNRRARIDYELPCIAKMEKWACGSPDHDD